MSFLSNWFKSKPRPSIAYMEGKIREKGNAEIVARLRRRAEIHDKAARYLQECSILDREAAHRIVMLERKLARMENKDGFAFEDESKALLEILREP